MHYFKLILILFLIISTKTFSQNAIVGNGFSTGWGGLCPTTGNTDFKPMTAGAGSSWVLTTNANGTGDQFFRMGIDWGGTTSQLTQTIGSDVEITTGMAVSLNTNCTTNGAMYLNVTDANHNYIFKTRDAGTSPSGDLIVFEVQGDVRNVISVSQNIPENEVFFADNVTITATLDNNLNTGQAVYLRYTTDNFVTSTVVNMTGSGTVFSADIPSATNTANSNIEYYVFTSGTDTSNNALTIAGADADFFSINLNNNSGSNYGYTVRSEYITKVSATDWNVASSWRADEIPPDDADVIIAHDLNLTDIRTAKSVQINNSINLNNNGHTLSIRDGGNITNNGNYVDTTGSVNFLGGGIVNGVVQFNNVELNGGVDFGATSTINGNLTINAGGFVNMNSPIYGNSSTLVYHINGTYDRRSEWSNAGIQGFPHNVVLENNTNLNMGADIPTDVAEISGDLTITSGSTLDMNSTGSEMQNNLIVGGDFVNHGSVNSSNISPGVSIDNDIIVQGSFTNTGTINLSTVIGRDLKIFGNFTNNGIFNFNNRALFFEGNQMQTLTAGNGFDIPFLLIAKNLGEVSLEQDIILSGNGQGLQMSDNGVLNLNGHQLQIGNITNTSVLFNDFSALKGSVSSKILFKSTDTSAGDLKFVQSGFDNYLAEMELDGTGKIGVSDTLNILNKFILKQGNFNSNGHLTFKSSDSITAVIPSVIGGNILGDVRIERYFPKSNRAFRYVSSPVTTPTNINSNWQEGVNNTSQSDANNQNPNPGFGTHITGSTSGANGFDATSTGNHSLFTFNTSNQDWDEVLNTNINQIMLGEAYALMIRGDRSTTLNSNSAVGPATTLRTTGSIITGQQSKTYNGAGADDFILVGNPYQARVDMTKVIANSSGIKDQFMYIYDPTIGSRGGYATVDLSDGSNTIDVTPGLSHANQFLQPFQAVFVQALASNPEVIFNEIDKTDSTINIGTFSTEDFNTTEVLEIELLQANTQTLVNAVKLKFSSNYSDLVSNEDAPKLWNSTERLALVNTENFLSIDKRNIPQNNDSIPLYISNYQTQDYQFNLTSTLNSNTEVKLYDRYLDQTFDIETNANTYNFSIDNNLPESTANDRFVLILIPQTLGLADDQAVQIAQIFPNPLSGELLYLNINSSLVGQKAELKLYDLSGRLLKSWGFQNIKPQEVLDFNNLANGVYLLGININGQSQTFKLTKI